MADEYDNRFSSIPDSTRADPNLSVRPTTGVVLMSFTGLVILHIIGAVIPSFYTWGFNLWSLAGLPAALAVCGVSVLLLIPPVFEAVFRRTDPIALSISRLTFESSRLAFILISSAVLLGMFYVLRSKAHVYGDGFLVLENFTKPGRVFSLYQDYLKPLAFLLHRGGLRLLGTYAGMSPENVFGLINAIGGLVGTWAVFRISKLLASDNATRLFILFGALGSGAMILFFGYVEYYTWSNAIGLWSLYLAMKSLRGESPSWIAVLTGLVAVALHIIAAPFLIAAILAMLFRGQPRSFPFGLTFRQVNIAFVAGSFLFVLFAQIADLPQWFMLIWPIPGVPYWFLSLGRIVDVVNHLVLVAPLVLPVAFVRLATPSRNETEHDPVPAFLGTASLLAFLAAFWIEPKLGAVRDWDFLALYGLPASLWGGWWLISRIKTVRPHLVIAPLILLIVHLAPNVYEKMSLPRAAQHLDAMLFDSPHHQTDYGEARRGLVWGVTLLEQADLPELAARHFRRRLEIDPDCASSLYNLGEVMVSRGDLDSARYFYANAARRDPANAYYLYSLADIEDKIGHLANALSHISMSVNLMPDHPAIQTKAGVIFSKSGQMGLAIDHFRKAHALDPSAGMPVMNMGIVYEYLKQYDSAFVYLRQAVALIPENPLIYEPLIRSSLALGRRADAEAALAALRKIRAGVPAMDFYQNQLLGAGRRP